MKVCVFGAGAIGGLIAGRLGRVPGVEVSVIARGEQLAAIRRNGLRVLAAEGEFSVPVRATDDPNELGFQDYVFITLKSHQVVGALDAMQPLLGPSTTVIPPTTGIPYWYFYRQSGARENMRIERLDPNGRQWAAIAPARVLGCVFWIASEVIEPGVIRQDGNFARLPVGEPDGSNSTRVKSLSQAMTAGGFDSPVVANIRSWIWIKMISSLCWNPIAVLTLATLGEITASAELVAVVRRMMGEADAVATALGGSPPMTTEERVGSARLAAHHKMSMLQDLERGRPLEYQVMVDSIEAMREIAGLDTPTIDEMLALFKLRVAKL